MPVGSRYPDYPGDIDREVHLVLLICLARGSPIAPPNEGTTEGVEVYLCVTSLQ